MNMMDISAYQQINIRMTTRGKRPLRSLTPSDKVSAIQRIHNGETKASVSRDIGVPESTLRGWCKNEQKLRFMCLPLGPEHLGLVTSDNPPEKRTKFGVQLISNNLKAMKNADKFSLGSFKIPEMAITYQKELKQEKIAYIKYIQNFGMCSDMVNHNQNINKGPLMTQSDYPDNHTIHELNFLALLKSSGLPASFEHSDISALPKPTNVSGFEQANLQSTATSFSSTMLNIKNRTEDPSKYYQSNGSQGSNDKNNNIEISNNPMSMPSACPSTAAIFSNNFKDTSISAQSEYCEANTNLMDWSKILTASYNFLAFAAAAASMQSGSDDSSLNSSLFEELNTSMIPNSSIDSYCDCEPEDLSVKSKITSSPKAQT